MIPGMNSNIKRNEKLYHVQTEDSGTRYGHVISHIFLEGVILSSEKTTYKHLLDKPSEELEAEVTAIMRAMHREMLRRLTAGQFDASDMAAPQEAVDPAASEPPIVTEDERRYAATPVPGTEDYPAQEPPTLEEDNEETELLPPAELADRLAMQFIEPVRGESLAERLRTLLNGHNA